MAGDAGSGPRRPTPPTPPARAAGSIAEPPSPTRTPSSATATASSIPPPSAASPTRPRCSSITRATTSAPASPTRSRSPRSPARSPGRSRLDDDLAEAVALGHDLGHTPFGHTGEDALDACMAAHGGFDHNSHGLRLVTELERRYADFDGLNLTQETLEGLVKHNGPLIDAAGGRSSAGASAAFPPRSSPTTACRASLWPNSPAWRRRPRRSPTTSPITRTTSTTACAPACSISTRSARSPFVAALLDEIDALHPGLERPRVIHELTRRVITRFIEDAIAESRARIAAAGVDEPEDARRAGRALVGFSAAMARPSATSRRFCSPTCTAIPRSTRCASRPTRSCGACFRPMSPSPRRCRPIGRPRRRDGEGERARAVADYIAGMTDRFALTNTGGSLTPRRTCDKAAASFLRRNS